MTHRLVSMALVGCILVATASGCARSETWPAQNVDGLHIPAIVWPEGTPDLNDERVAIVFNVEVALAAATNAHDFSSPHLRRYATEEYIAGYADLAVGATVDPDWPSAEFAYDFVAGPAPTKVEAVRDTATGAQVDVCSAGWSYPWLNNNTDPDPVDYLGEHKNGVAWRYELTRQPDDTLLVSDSHLRAIDDCSTNNVKYGVFDPQPPYGTVVHEADFIQPDGTHGRPTS